MLLGMWGTRWGRNGAGGDGPVGKEAQRPLSIFCFEGMLGLMIKSLMKLLMKMKGKRLRRKED